MIADLLLRMFGRSPAEFSEEADKWPVIFAGTAFYGAPIVLLLLFLAPFIYLLIRRKKFDLKNILISIVVGIGLVALGIYTMYWGIMILHGLAVRDIYGGQIF